MLLLASFGTGSYSEQALNMVAGRVFAVEGRNYKVQKQLGEGACVGVCFIA